MSDPNQSELFSDLDVLDLARALLRDLHDDLPERVGRFRYVTEISASMGAGGTMIFGGHAAHSAYIEARSSFVNGNFIATILLCQSLVENLLAAFLYAASDGLPDKVHFNETLRRCRARNFLNEDDARSLERLVALRNPLVHFRNVNDTSNLTRRSIDANLLVDDLLERDASFAIGVAIKILSKKPFRVGDKQG